MIRTLVIVSLLATGVAQAAPRLDGGLHAPTPATVAACFIPAQVCVDAIVGQIDRAKSDIRVQGYGFTSPPILEALARAHKQRGVHVEIILDKSNDRAARASDAELGTTRNVGAPTEAAAGIPVWIDRVVAIAHNKLVIIDKHLVIGGSYNYTLSAEQRNAENVTFIDSPVVAQWFIANFESRKAVSTPFAAAMPPKRRT